MSLNERKILRKKACTDLFWFATYILGYKFLSEDLHRSMSSFIDVNNDKEYKLLLIPRGFGKTTLFSVADTIRILLRDPNACIAIGHAKRETAVKILSDIKGHFEDNDFLKWIGSDICFADPQAESLSWTQDEIVVNRTKRYRVPSVTAFGIEASVVGLHFDVIKLDDIVLDVNIGTADQIEKVKEFFRRCRPLLKGMGWRKIHVIGTRWHPDDLYGMLTDPTGPYARDTDKLVLSCYDEQGNSIWPEAFPTSLLEDERKRMGSYLFSCNYLNSPLPPGTQVFKEEDIQRYEITVQEDGSFQPDLPKDRPVNIFTSVDPNTREDTNKDAAVVLTMALDCEGNDYVLDITRGHPTGTELISWIRAHVLRWRPRSLFLETVQAQAHFVHWLQVDSIETGVRYPLREVMHGGDKSKFERIIAVQPTVENHKFFVPRGGKFDDIVHEMYMYAGKSSKRDDILDCIADIHTHGERPPKPDIIPQRPMDPYMIRNILRFHDSPTHGVRSAGRPVGV
jgi:predicted phage terminase large subunit-like protein